MPDHERQRQSYRRQLIDYLRAAADRLETEERAEACQRTEVEARLLRAQMRRINRKGHLAVVTVALWLLQRPLEAFAIAGAAGIIAWGGITTPWTDGDGTGRQGPPARAPQARSSPTPTATRAASPSPTGETPTEPEASWVAGPPQPVPADTPQRRMAAPSPSPSPTASATPPGEPMTPPRCLVDLGIPLLGAIELLCDRPDLDPPLGIET